MPTRQGIHVDELRPYLGRDRLTYNAFADRVGMSRQTARTAFNRSKTFVDEGLCLRICEVMGIPYSSFSLPVLSQLPAQIRKVRVSKGLTLKTLGELCGVHLSVIATVELRPSKRYNVGSVQKIEDVLGPDIYRYFHV